MLRVATFAIAVAALIVNALTPRAIYHLDSQNGAKLITLPATQDDAQVGRPHSAQRLRVCSRAFSCPPLPNDPAGDYILAVPVAVEELGFATSKELCNSTRTPSATPNILKWQCRLNI